MPIKTKEKKVEVSWTNFVLGGSFVSVSASTNGRKVSGRKIAVVEVDAVCVPPCVFSLILDNWAWGVMQVV